ncbi:pilus assembly protein [bacterium M00.F.Ca.ET.228.01.1.1]|nr:pilus assembly protein [Paraburkholderia phenoliruptrix]MBW9132539.1 pilus assembly protein [Paraburkholderia ginsengiterrae]TGP39659.1 pilus assembly protein [bacterium M00.F.Ca.ET.228.01.1.1]TGR95492.1 pilus assembly protein [bacterium M00.F.Ca.ET.191.01.1.1]TGT96418.1 pilus assembly protein [bacterium M00.F.Ca.ET.155.01.1.1]
MNHKTRDFPARAGAQSAACADLPPRQTHSVAGDVRRRQQRLTAARAERADATAPTEPTARALAASRRRGPRREAGVAVVEFGLILPLLLLLVFGMVEFSIALYDKAVITNASREAARAGVMYKVPPLTPAQITTVAQNYASTYLITFGTSTPVSVAVDQSSGTTTGQPLKVTLTYSYSGVGLGSIVTQLVGSVPITAVTTMNYE